VQYFERTLDDSANRRLVIPEAFLAADAILILMQNVAGGLCVHPEVIRRRVDAELPFMATEKIIVRAVEAGADRQAVHEIIRRHSMDASAAMKAGAAANDLLQRLAGDPEFALSKDDITSAADPAQFVGRAPEQVDEFLAEVVDPLLAQSAPTATSDSEIRV
jgi:adenylosuccinate lyase